MSLRRKILFKDLALLASLLLMIGFTLWGLLRQRQHVQASLNEYTALQKVEEAETHLVAFQQRLHAGALNEPNAMADLQAASLNLRQYKAIISQYNSILPPEITAEEQQQAKTKTDPLVRSLVSLTKQLAPPVNASKTTVEQVVVDPAVIAAQTDELSRELTDLLSICNGFVHKTWLASADDLRLAITGVSVIAGCTLIVALLASLWQYQLVMQPLNRLRRWCRQTAEGDFSIRYMPTHDREFQELGRDVNKMADELAAFHRRLEAMVASKSRELVRSERLASVGYLAAGVAHEINSPLNIMSGYAELSLKRLGRLSQIQSPGECDAQVIQHLSIIRSEAFRCKEITQKLLSLAKGNGDVRGKISLADAITEVAGMVRGLKSMRGKNLLVHLPVDQPLHVTVNLTEIKQVLLNLMVNAIEAVIPGRGNVVVEARRAGAWIEVDVTDNGRGMSAETRERVFEPFFTNKRGSDQPGTGLGLSITHAIIENHHGHIFAYSDGPDLGSRFTIRLPADSSEALANNQSQSLEAVVV
jgi:signal transduction histidine kinase